MCGIHGIVRFDHGHHEDLKGKVDTMLDVAKHRGPDQSDVFVSEQAVIGMNRLAIVAPAEHSTIQSAIKGSIYSVLNGEIVNHRELRELLDNTTHLGKSDSSVILPLAEKFGDDFVNRLAGMFAIAIYNVQNNRLQLLRDPLGIKPLYYHLDSNGVVFSSELKSIYAVLDHFPEVDFGAIDHILRYRFHPGRPTVYPEIKRVVPGETVTFDRNLESRKTFWQLKPNSKETETINLDRKIEACRDILTRVVKENTQADVKGGFFVSGGLDSSLITSMGLRTKSTYKTPISLQFSPNPVIDEKYATLLENYFGVSFEWVEISDDGARKALEESIMYMDEPLENPIHIGTYLMAKRARELGIKSVLTGDGSDEFFIGYDRHKPWFNKDVNPSEAYPPYLWTLSPADAQALYTDEAKALLKPMIGYSKNTIEPFINVDQALHFERFDRLAEYHCNRLDRMTMGCNVEARVPFLDHRVVDFTLQINHKTHVGISGKEFLQKVAEPFLPREILQRPKIHFPSLADQWTSGDGAKWAENILLDDHSCIRKWIKTDVLASYIKEHQEKKEKRGRVLWALVTLELWLKQNQLFNSRSS